MRMGLMKKIDSGVLTSLRNDRIITRPGASPGTWASALLPTAVIVTALTFPVSDLYKLCAVYSANLLLNSILLLYSAKKNGSILVLEAFNWTILIPVSLSAYLYSYVTEELHRCIFYAVANACMFFEFLLYILKAFPKSFSFGEACVVSQGLALFIFSSFISINRILINASNPIENDLDIAALVLRVVLLLVLVVCAIPTRWSPSRQYMAVGVILLLIMPVLQFLLGFSVIYWALELIFTGSRLKLICGWAACSGLAWGTVVVQVKSQRTATTDSRKVFHFLAVAVFLSGILSEPLLLYFAAGLVFPLFILIEFIRIRKLPPLADALQSGFLIYADEKDAGGIALTPIYLLLGCSLPLWLLPDVEGRQYTLPLLSGVLSIGIGDSCASIIGKNFGRQKWSGSNKTVEGSVGCALGQMAALVILAGLGHVPVYLNMNLYKVIKPLLVVCFTSLVEAKTDQVDNLVLPLLTYILLLL